MGHKATLQNFVLVSFNPFHAGSLYTGAMLCLLDANCYHFLPDVAQPSGAKVTQIDLALIR